MGISLDRARQIVDGWSGKRVLVVGDVVMDRYIYGKVERLNPEAPVPVLHAKDEETATGAAGNTAKNAAQLGVDTTLVGVVGTDRAAEELRADVTNEGYTAQLIADASRPTIVKNRFLVRSQQMLRVDYERTHDIDGDVEEGVIEAVREQARGVDAILVSDYAKGVVTERVARTIMDAAREHGLPIMADVKPSRIPFFTGATYIAPNRKEAHEYLGLNQFEQNGKSKEELAEMLRESFDTSVFLTLSADGMYVLGKGEDAGVHLPVEYVKADEVLDPSGCGDTAAVAILLSRLAGADFMEAGDLANAASATVAKKIGSVGLSGAELLHTIEHHHA